MPRPPELPDFPASQLFLRRLAYSLVHDEARAEDLVQDTWAAWVEHRPSGVAEPKAWLARVLRNRAFNLKRNDERRARRETFAGRPDPSAPETDGTLEAQAKLIEALRELAEPYRSTLLQRYYHDLAPKEIAERAGTPLNTVKARLARGLEQLRAAMDQRYRGDRRAWCHWLTVSGSAPPIVVPHASAPLTGVGGSASMLAWVGVVAAVAAGAVWKSGWSRAPEIDRPRAETRVAPTPSSETRVAPEAEHAVGSRPPPSRLEPPPFKKSFGEPAASKEPGPSPDSPWWGSDAAAPVTAGERERFEWPQYAGGPEHDNWREREAEVHMPVVQWFLPGCSGQPTLSGGELYTGGVALARIDPLSGAMTAVNTDEIMLTLLDDAGFREGEELEEHEILRLAVMIEQLRQDDPRFHGIAGAPVLTPTLVLARRTRDGGVLAYDRGLEELVWSWEPPESGFLRASSATRIPLCLASDEVVLVPQFSRLVALSVQDGEELWSFTSKSLIRMVPACADGRVFFGTDQGVFHALDLETGEELWQTALDAGGWTPPVVLGRRVLCADRGGDRVRGEENWSLGEAFEPERGPGHLRALDAETGRELWSTEFAGFGLSMPGIGPDWRYALAGFGREVARFSLANGRIDEGQRVKTAGLPFLAPAVVGRTLVSGALKGDLYLRDLDRGELRWAFRPPGNATLDDFVHTGKRIYVATSVGLFCIGDDEKQAPPAPGYVLEWNGDTTKPFSVVETK